MASTHRTTGGYVRWTPEKFEKNLDRKLKRNMMLALALVKRETMRNVGKPTAVHGPSKPGEFPHKVSQDLLKSIFIRGPRVTKRSVEGDIGTPLDYAIYHEITERPFMRRTVAELSGQIGRILSAG